MLLDDLNNPDKLARVANMNCSMCLILSKLTADEATKLSALLADETVSKAALARILTSNGYKISGGTISRHSRRECRDSKG